MGITYATKALEYVKRVFDGRVPTEPILSQPTRKEPPAYIAIKQPLTRARPEDVGIPSALVYNFLRELKEDKTLVNQSIMIVSGGKVICEAAFGPYEFNLPRMTFSECKSVVSLAIGLLIDEKKLSLSDSVAEIFGLGPITGKRYEKLTVEDVLTMRTSSCFNEIGAFIEDNWEKEYFTILSGGTIGKTFFYNSLNTYILSCIVRKKSGVGLLEYLRPRLLKPLGIEGAYWEKCPRGTERGGWGLFICPEDLAKLGLLVLGGGIWNGKRIISKEYLDKATEHHVRTPANYGNYDYGYQIWVGRDSNSFLFNGMFGQNTLCFRDTSTVIVSNACNNEFFQQSSYYACAEKYFASPDYPACNAKDGKNLSSYITYLSHPDFIRPRPAVKLERSRLTKEMTKKLDGAVFSASNGKAMPIGILPMVLQVTGNCFAKGLSSIGFENRSGKFYILINEADAGYSIPVGFDDYEMTDISVSGILPYRVASCGRFVINEDDLPVLRICLRFVETPCLKVIRLIFDGKTLHYGHEEAPGVPFVKRSISFFSGDYLGKGILASMNLDEKLNDSEYLIYKAASKLAPKADFIQK